MASAYETLVADEAWPARHCAAIREAFRGAPFTGAVEPILAALTSRRWERLAELTIATTLAFAPFLGVERRVRRSSKLAIGGARSGRLIAICRTLGATRYVTGHGALAYLDHEAFESAGIAVEYMDYDVSPYPQLHGAFEPHVTALDVLANTGPQAPAHVTARTVPWREMLARRGVAAEGAR